MISHKHIVTADKVVKFWESLELIEPLDKVSKITCQSSLNIFYPNTPKDEIDRLDFMYISDALYVLLQYSAVLALTTENPSKEALVALIKENQEGFIKAVPTPAATAALFGDFTYDNLRSIAKKRFPKTIPGKRNPNSPFNSIHVVQHILNKSTVSVNTLSTPGICVIRIISPYLKLPCIFNNLTGARALA